MANHSEKAIQLYNKAINASSKGNLKSAIKLYREALQQSPKLFQAANNLGNIYKSLNRLDSATYFYDVAHKIVGDNPIIFNNLGIVHRLNSKDAEAKYCFENAITLDPNYLEARFNLVDLLLAKPKISNIDSHLQALGEAGIPQTSLDLLILRHDSTIKYSTLYKEALDRITLFLDDFNHKNKSEIKKTLSTLVPLGISICLESTLLKVAKTKGYNHFIEDILESMHENAHCAEDLKLHFLFDHLKELINPKKLIKDILSFKNNFPNNPNADRLLFEAFFWSGNITKAKEILNELNNSGIQLPTNANWFYFQSHDFKNAWPLYLNESTSRNKIELDINVKESDIRNNSVLIIADQGIGDQVMFLSVLEDLHTLSPKQVTITSDYRLDYSIKRSFPKIKFTKDFQLNDYDFVTNLSSLSGLLRTDISQFKRSKKYLLAEPELVNEWAAHLNDIPQGLRIGFAWKGGSSAHKLLSNTKSLELDSFCRLFALPDTQWINLQYGGVTNELKPLQERYLNIHNFEEIDPIKEIENQLALISNLDLVIQPSNASIHFSGALGVKSWVLLGHPHDFRWFSNGVDDQSAWYPSVRMIKKNQNQNWEELVESLVPELTALAASKS